MGDSCGERRCCEAKHPACRQFGTQPGLDDILGSSIGLPPSWTDGGAKRN